MSRVDLFLEDRARRKKDRRTVTSGFRKGSKGYHGKDKARDIRTRDKTDDENMSLMNDALLAGFGVGDEREKPGAPHIHLDEGQGRLFRVGKDKKVEMMIPNTKDIISSRKHEERKGMRDRQTINEIPELLKRREDEQEMAAIMEAEAIKQKAQKLEVQARGAAQVAMAPVKVKEKLVDDAPLPHHVKKQVKEDLSSGSNFIQKVREVQEKKDAGQPTSIKDSFMEALTFFAPQAIGLIAGGLVEGAEGAVAGAEEAGKLASSFREYKFKKEELLAKRQKSKDKSKDFKTFVNIEDGTPVIKHEDNSFTDLSGNVVPPSSITQAVNFRQTRSLAQRREEEGSKQDRFTQRFGLDQKKVAQLSDKQVDALASADEVIMSIDRMSKLKGSVNTGVISNAINSMLEVVDMAPKGFTELKSTSNDSLAKYVKSISGAQVSEQEARRLGTIIPTTADDDETFVRKLKTFKAIVESNKQSFTNAVKSGQPLRKIKGLDEAVNQFSKGKPRQSRQQMYQDAIKNAKSVEEIREIQKQYGVIK